MKVDATAWDNEKYLLRITPFDKSVGRDEMFRMQQQVVTLGIPICRPVEIGTCEEEVLLQKFAADSLKVLKRRLI